MANKIPLADYSGKLQEIASGDIIPISKLATGTPDGTKFIRDDGTLATPASSSGITIGVTTITSGTDTRLLFNDSGVVGEDNGITYNKTTDTLTLVGNVIVSDDAYDAIGWNSNFEVPTKNAVRDKIESLSGSTPHALLSVTHSDTTAAAVQRGDLITGQTASPVWQRLAKGSANQFFQSDGTDIAWVSMSGDATLAAGVLTVANSAISLAKQANVATSTVFYRKTAGTGAPEVQTLATLKTDLGLTGTNSGDQTISLTGDVTGSGTGSFAATIATAAVTLAKMADVATSTVFYRKTAGTGVPEVQTLTTLKTDLGLTGTNSGDLTISGENYLSLTGQALTANAVNLSGTNVTGTLAAGRFPALTGDVTTVAGALATTIANDAVTYAKMQNISATSRIMGRISVGAGDMEELTGTQATTLLDVFTSALKGLVPLSGGGTTNFLRADGTWAAPGGGGGGGTVTDFIFTDGNGFDGTVSSSTTTPTLSLLTTVANKSVIYSASGALTASMMTQETGQMLITGVDGTTPFVVDSAEGATQIATLKYATSIVFDFSFDGVLTVAKATAAIPTPSAGYVNIASKSNLLYVKNSDGKEAPLQFYTALIAMGGYN